MQPCVMVGRLDSLALRVGNEKDEDEADTVGCCSLRVEHMQFPAEDHVELNFLGKDSMPYHQVIGNRLRLTRGCIAGWVGIVW
jgi:DNA topoisomerase I